MENFCDRCLWSGLSCQQGRLKISERDRHALNADSEGNRRRAQEYLEFAKAAKEQYTKQAMEQLAEEFNKAADRLEHSLP
jgi:hypothetical protein